MVLAAGVMTFGNEWLQTGKPNWRVPIATLLGAGAVGLIGNLSTGAANSLGFMVVIAAAATKINGKSPFQEFTQALPHNKGQ